MSWTANKQLIGQQVAVSALFARHVKLNPAKRDALIVFLDQQIDRQTTAIARMLEDLLDASRIAFGKVSVQLEPFDFRAFLKDVLDEQEPHARQAGLQLISNITEHTCYVNADRMRLRQIVIDIASMFRDV